MRTFRAIVLLATRDGERWIERQITSIQQQSISDWLLLVSDDGSADGTVSIVRSLAETDARIVLLPSRLGNPGHAANFEYLLQNSKKYLAPLILLADQDDVWHPEKIGELEAALVSNTSSAQLAYSQVKLIDDSGVSIGLFFEGNQRDNAHSLGMLIAEASIPGCSMAITPELLNIALPFPPRQVNHDWWLSMCAAVHGRIRYVDEPLTEYRQHGANLLGAGIGTLSPSRLIRAIGRQRRVFAAKQVAVQALLERKAGIRSSDVDLLRGWIEDFGGPMGFKLARKLAISEFGPQAFLLRTVQVLALSPIGGWMSKFTWEDSSD